MTGVLRKMFGVAASLALLSCAGSPPPGDLEPVDLSAAEPPPDELAIEASRRAAISRQPDVPLAERWSSPFAVSSSGRTALRTPRGVTVLGADAAIAAGIAELDASGTRTAAAGPSTDASASSAASTSNAAGSTRSAVTASAGATAAGGGGASVPGANTRASGDADAGPTASTSASSSAESATSSVRADSPAPTPSAPATAEAPNTPAPVRTASAASTPPSTAGSSSTGSSAAGPSTAGSSTAPSAASSALTADDRATGADFSVRLIGEPIDDDEGIGLRSGAEMVASASAAGESGSASAPESYLVEPGDSWIGIARDHGVTFSQLQAANPTADPERIRIGQVLQIPAVEGASVPRNHRVVVGDTLSEIAERYGVSMGVLRQANDLSSDVIRTGQVLTIPPTSD